MYLKFTLLHVWFSRIYGNEDVAKYILICNLYKYTHAKYYIIPYVTIL